jgi:hypothetical protein
MRSMARRREQRMRAVHVRIGQYERGFGSPLTDVSTAPSTECFKA